MRQNEKNHSFEHCRWCVSINFKCCIFIILFDASPEPRLSYDGDGGGDNGNVKFKTSFMLICLCVSVRFYIKFIKFIFDDRSWFWCTILCRCGARCRASNEDVPNEEQRIYSFVLIQKLRKWCSHGSMNVAEEEKTHEIFH